MTPYLVWLSLAMTAVLKPNVRIIENLLREGMEWAAIERVTGVNEAQFQALKQQVEDLNE